MSTHRCSPQRRSPDWPWRRAVTMSTRRSAEVATRHWCSRRWVGKAACWHSTGIRRPLRPAGSALPTKCGLRSCTRRLPTSARSCRRTRAIVPARREQPLDSTRELAALVASAVRTREPGKHPATRTFQALRMFINDELGQLERGLAGALERLAPGGRLAVITFHSLEDRAVKRFMQRGSQVDPALRRLPLLPAAARPRLKLIGRKTRPTAAELERNPRARSALLRVAERLA